VPSLVPGLDAVLCGGFLQGGLYMVQGPPGAGKAVLANQVIYSRAAKAIARSSSPCSARAMAA
jgi:circadian clock protein KaiC